MTWSLPPIAWPALNPIGVFAVVVLAAVAWWGLRRTGHKGPAGPAPPVAPASPPPQLSDARAKNVGRSEPQKRTGIEERDGGKAGIPARLRALFRRWREPQWVELTVGFDSPSDVFVYRLCDACRRGTWVFASRAGAARIICRRCLHLLAATPAAPEPAKPAPPAAAPAAPVTPPAPPKRDAQAERTGRIRAWNDEYAEGVNADVDDTLRLAVHRKTGESDEEYRARLRTTAGRWARTRAALVSPPTPEAGAGPSSPARPASRRTARRGARKKG